MVSALLWVERKASACGDYFMMNETKELLVLWYHGIIFSIHIVNVIGKQILVDSLVNTGAWTEIYGRHWCPNCYFHGYWNVGPYSYWMSNFFVICIIIIVVHCIIHTIQ